MAEFLDENNPCGQTLLRIVSIGNSIIAEILRLKDYIPEVFKLETKALQQKYNDVILDFSYIKISEQHEKKIESNIQLQKLDKEIKENYLDLLTRFYLAFESTHQYALDLKCFIQHLQQGYYIQNSIESVMEDDEGKQLMCEALYLFGVMLLVIDFHIPGNIREHLIISYYRYSAAKSSSDSSIDDVVKLLRSTSFSTAVNAKRILNYPENYFGRFQFDQYYIDLVIGRLRSDDIYNQNQMYLSHPDHRSTALSNQAALLYICLYFSPKILHNQIPQMREIVDKFFADNFVISLYMGITVNLIDAWDNYRAAKAALNGVYEPLNLKEICIKHKEKRLKLLPKTQNILQEGVLTEDYILKNITTILHLIRDCNVTLRWYLLHTAQPILEFGGVTKKYKQIMDQIQLETGFKYDIVFELLLNVSHLELCVKELLREVMQDKLNRWNLYANEAKDRMLELKEAFSGVRMLSKKIQKNQNLEKWFLDISEEISSLSLDTPIISGRKIIQLIQALETVQEFHNLQSNMQVKQYLDESREYLYRMVQVANIKEDILINIQIISDLSYAWRIVENSYTSLMQESIKKKPDVVIRLRAVFLKLSTALEIPLLRINQARSDDLISVSQYYSSELSNYIRRVLQVIPKTMFELLEKIVALQTDVIKELPTRLDKEKLKEFEQLEDRFKVSKLTYIISIFTEGILQMKKTLVGVIELDPKQLLEDGIRKELVIHLSKAFHQGLIFTGKGRSSDLEIKLNALIKVIDGYRRSFEYIQDYLNINGLRILQEEVCQIIEFNVEQECNKYRRTKTQDWQSEFQNTTIPIVVYPPIDTDSVNFIGRLATEILKITDPKQTVYLDLQSSWHEKIKSNYKETINSKIFLKILNAIGPHGLIGLNKLYSLMFITDLEENIEKLQKNIQTDKMWSESLNDLTKKLEENEIIENPAKFYQSYSAKWNKVWPKILEWLMSLGQKQVLRLHISHELNSNCKINAKNLENSLNTFNKALLVEYMSETQSAKPDDKILAELSPYLELTGLTEPMKQIFMITKNSHYVPLFLFLFTVSYCLPKLQFAKNIECLLGKSPKEQIDSIFIYGILTVLRQYHNSIMELYIEYLCQYVKSLVDSNLRSKQELSNDVKICLNYLEVFIRTAKVPRNMLEERIPDMILNEYELMSQRI